jgi:hypothetical protein
MRSLLIAVAVATLLAAACAPVETSRRARLPATTTPIVQTLIAVDPRQLVLDEKAFLPGQWKMQEGTLFTGQWNRAWDRDPADPGSITGATRVTIQATLFPSLEESSEKFAQTAVGAGGRDTVQRVIALRGFDTANIQVTEVPLDGLGLDEQAAWRAEFSRGSATERYVQYFVYLRVRNVHATLTTFAQSVNGTEVPKLLEETKQLAQREAALLRAQPATPQVVPTPAGPSATGPGPSRN